MVNSSKKCQDEWGLKGYELIDYNPNVDKPIVYLISKESAKPRDYISMVQKNKAYIPSPDKYKVELDISKNGKFFIPKGNVPNFIT